MSLKINGVGSLVKVLSSSRLALAGAAMTGLIGAGGVTVAAGTMYEAPQAAASTYSDAASGASAAAYGVGMERLKIGDTVPDFDFVDIEGKTHKLYDYKDKIVVLEWVNPTCRYSEYEHAKGFLKDWPETMKSKGVTFIAINSAEEGDWGSSKEANQKMKDSWKISYPIYLDQDQKIARKFGAHMTPEMFIIDKTDKLVYFGAPSNAPMGKIDADMPNGGKTDVIVNYVQQAVDEINTGKSVSIATTKPWGCNIKHDKEHEENNKQEHKEHGNHHHEGNTGGSDDNGDGGGN